MAHDLIHTICHICLNGPYNENWNYQENLIPKYHALMGYNVFQIVTHYYWNEGRIDTLPEQKYVNKYGVKIIRVHPDAHSPFVNKRFERYSNAFEELERINPDYLFIHDVQFMDIDRMIVYLKNHENCIAVVDNHSDYFNSAKNWFSKNILHRIIWRRRALQICPYIKRFYGVLPARVNFLTEMYKIPKDKCELLVMGADDELVERAIQTDSRTIIRKRFNIEEKDFLIVTGGKINKYRPETLALMRAVQQISANSVKLLVFGVVAADYKKEFDELCKCTKINYAGWVDSSDTYNYMAAADLMCFPGLHSVMWEQAVGMGIPCVFRKLEGFDHVDLHGNAVFIDDISVEGIKKTIETVALDMDYYEQMNINAKEKGIKTFSYREIARRCIDSVI